MNKTIKTIIFAAAVALFSCAFAASKKSIVCATYPEYDWVMNILGDKAASFNVTLLQNNGTDLHSYQASIKDIAKISICDMLVFVGGESDEWVEKAVAEAKNKNMIVVNMMEALGDKVKEEEIVEGMQAEEEEEHERADHDDDHDHDAEDDQLGVERDDRVIADAEDAKDKGDEIPLLVEKGKAAFSGPELTGKPLGVIGLGAIGSLIANIAVKLGMNVIGFDPYLSVDAAWRLSRSVQHAVDVDEIFIKSDYISINVPFTERTKHMLDAAAFRKMKQGVRIINESRAEVVDDDAMLEALASGKVGKYITDFPNKKLIGVENVICMPHLGACTPESEEKSSVMAAHEMYDYLANGNIKNSVNFPDATLERMGTSRLCILHFNKPTMLNQFLQIACSTGLNVENMINKAYRDYAYAMIDLNGELSEEQVEALKSIPDVIRVRVV